MLILSKWTIRKFFVSSFRLSVILSILMFSFNMYDAFWGEFSNEIYQKTGEYGAKEFYIAQGYKIFTCAANLPKEVIDLKLKGSVGGIIINILPDCGPYYKDTYYTTLDEIENFRSGNYEKLPLSFMRNEVKIPNWWDKSYRMALVFVITNGVAVFLVGSFFAIRWITSPLLGNGPSTKTNPE